jgi:hypothetical protein
MAETPPSIRSLPDDVRRIVRREVDCQLRDFQRIGDPLAWIVGSEDALNRLALLFAWDATEHRRVRRPGLRVFTRIPRPTSSALRIRARWLTAALQPETVEVVGPLAELGDFLPLPRLASRGTNNACNDHG